MNITIVYGIHPNEYTKYVAKPVANILAGRGYDISVHEMPIKKTGLGLAIRGHDLNEVRKAFNMYFYIPVILRTYPEADYIFDFHAAPDKMLNPEELPAEKLKFSQLFECGSIQCSSWDKWIPLFPFMCGNDDFLDCCHDNSIKKGYAIEIPNIFKRASEGFIKSLKKKYGKEIENFLGEEAKSPNYPEWPNNFTKYFKMVADKASTIKKYPPDVMANIIANGIEEGIIGYKTESLV